MNIFTQILSSKKYLRNGTIGDIPIMQMRGIITHSFLEKYVLFLQSQGGSFVFLLSLLYIIVLL